MKCLTRHLRSLLRQCTRRSCISSGRKIHAIILTTGLANIPTSFLNNVLLHFYASCDDTFSARQLFDKIPSFYKDYVDWTALMFSYARHTSPRNALHLFVEMRREVDIDDVTMVCFFGVCAHLEDVGMGIQGHGYAVKTGFLGSLKVGNAVMDMYGKCGLVGEVRCLFEEMDERSVVSWTVLLDNIVKWEGVESGRRIFDEMPERNEVSWTVMIVGYVRNGFTHQGFALLGDALCLRGRFNFVTLCSILLACAQSGDVIMGRWVHVYALKLMEKETNIMVGTALVDMYAKCGRINTAYKVFQHMPQRNVVTWNAMLSGLAMHGKGTLVFDIFPEMIKEVNPDDLTFIAVLSACSHSGLVENGWYCFKNLESVYGLKPKAEHYACMVDLLGRAGRLEEAEILIKHMPMPPNKVLLGSLLGSCNVHGKLQLGERLLQQLVEMDPLNTQYHILLSNIYALAGRQDKANSLREILKNRGIRKVPGMSSIHVGGQAHQFSAGDKSHLRMQEIYLKLDDVIRRLRSAGYVPNTSLQVFSGIDRGTVEGVEEKEQALFSHSEKLAVCLGLISTKPGMPLYIFKNLRICQDCHSAIKIISKIYSRKIVVRDRNRFHCFHEGSCSCSDYW